METDSIELGRRAALYLTLEDMKDCPCHCWWGSATLVINHRDYRRFADHVNRQLREPA